MAEIDCRSNEKLCKKLGVEYGTRYFAAGEVEKGKAVVSDLTSFFFSSMFTLYTIVDTPQTCNSVTVF